MPFLDVLTLANIALSVLLVFLVLQRRSGGSDIRAGLDQLGGRIEAVNTLLAQIPQTMRDEQGALRRETNDASAALRKEIAEQFGRMGEGNAERIKDLSAVQKDELGQFGAMLNQRLGETVLRQDRLTESLEKKQDEVRERLDQKLTAMTASLDKKQQEMREGMESRLTGLTENIGKQQAALRDKIDEKLKELREDNSVKLEEMRQTVDEKLQTTLEKRLGDSFNIVSTRLAEVHKGLGEMQALAGSVGDLKRTLTNVKTRGTWAEVQLAALISDMLSPEQFIQNAQVNLSSQERVEFAVRFPGRGRDSEPVLLAIDSKFPVEDYDRLVAASDAGNVDGVNEATKALVARITQCAADIGRKYINPPHTTDFAIMYLPTEGLYAEIVRRPGLASKLQHDYRVIVTGPTTLSALLSSLQMGFRTLQIEKRSSEVWQVLGAVKTEFGKFGEVVDKVKKKLQEAGNQLDTVDRRSRAIGKQLRSVEQLNEEDTRSVLRIEQIAELEPAD